MIAFDGAKLTGSVYLMWELLLLQSPATAPEKLDGAKLMK
jgi:hypothetical protein